MPMTVPTQVFGHHRRWPRRSAAAAALALALLSGSGCGRAHGPEVPNLPVLRPAGLLSSPWPADAAPGGALRDARAVVRRYFAALDDLRRRMRTAPLRRLMTADCPCADQVRAVRAAMRRDEHYTDRIRVLSLVAHRDRDDLIDVVVSFDVRHGGLADSRGHRLRPPTTLRNVHREVLLQRLGRRWLISQVLAA